MPEVAAAHPLWEVGPTDEVSIRAALSTCLAVVRDEDEAASILTEGGWSERPFPDYIDDTLSKTVFEHANQSELIAVGKDEAVGTVCSVLSSASHTMLVDAVGGIESGFADGMQMMPHGPVWVANGIIVNNDYANMHVFQPEVFDPDSFRDSRLSDIRIFRCQEQC